MFMRHAFFFRSISDDMDHGFVVVVDNLHVASLDWVCTSTGSMLSIRVRSIGATLNRMVFETNSWSLSEF